MTAMSHALDVELIPLTEISADDTFNCRGAIAPIDVQDLIASILEQKGLLQPVVVCYLSATEQIARPGKKFKLLAGFRRHMAMTVLGETKIPCTVKREVMSDIEARCLNLTENLARQNLTMKQEADAVGALMAAGANRELVAKRLNVSASWVQFRMYLLAMPEPIQAAAALGIFKQNHIRELHSVRLSYGDDEMLKVAKSLKEQHQRGERLVIKPQAAKTTETLNKKKQRTPKEIEVLLLHLIDEVDKQLDTSAPRLHTQVLAWALGNKTTLELYDEIRAYSAKNNVEYNVTNEEGPLP